MTSDRVTFAAAILAGGRGTRLGGVDKSGLAIGARTILERQLMLLRELTPHILIIANDPTRFRGAGVPVIGDRVEDAGALGGLYTALMEAPTEQVLAIACDMPFLTRPLLTRLVTLGADVDAAIPRDARGRHPLCASYRTRVAPRLRARIDAGLLRVGDALDGMLVRELGPAELEALDPTGRLLLNVNTPDDYASARAYIEAEVGDR